MSSDGPVYERIEDLRVSVECVDAGAKLRIYSPTRGLSVTVTLSPGKTRALGAALLRIADEVDEASAGGKGDLPS